jgi:hypothetical protein
MKGFIKIINDTFIDRELSIKKIEKTLDDLFKEQDQDNLEELADLLEDLEKLEAPE